MSMSGRESISANTRWAAAPALHIIYRLHQNTSIAKYGGIECDEGELDGGKHSIDLVSINRKLGIISHVNLNALHYYGEAMQCAWNYRVKDVRLSSRTL